MSRTIRFALVAVAAFAVAPAALAGGGLKIKGPHHPTFGSTTTYVVSGNGKGRKLSVYLDGVRCAKSDPGEAKHWLDGTAVTFFVGRKERHRFRVPVQVANDKHGTTYMCAYLVTRNEKGPHASFKLVTK